MRGLVLLATLWLVHSSAASTDFKTIEPGLEAQFTKLADDLLASISQAHARAQPRARRHLDLQTALMDDSGVYRLQTIYPVTRLCSPALYTQFLDIEGVTYAVCVSAMTQYTPAEVIVGIYQDHIWTVQFQWYVNDPVGMAAFYFKPTLYVSVAESEKKGVILMKLNLTTGEKVLDHTTSSDYASCLSVWKMKVDEKFHLAVGNLPESNSSDTATEVYVYEWLDTYFDRYQVLLTYDVRDVEPFNIFGSAYMVVANFQRGNSLMVDSEIFKYSLHRKSWMSHQKILTYGATDWEFFTMGSGLKQEFFLAVANKESEVSMGPMIYKFVRDKFVPFQCLHGSAISLASWNTDTEFLLAVSTYEGVHLYQYDGWVFVLSNVQYIHGTMSTGEKRMVFHSVPNAGVASTILSISNPYMPQELSVFEMGFQFENHLKNWYERSKEWCFNTLAEVESSTTDSAIKLLDDVVFIDQTHPIVINGSLYFDKGFETAKLKTSQLKQMVTNEVYDNKMLLDLQNLQQKLQNIGSNLQRIEEVLSKAVKTDGDQSISGDLVFEDVSFDCQNYSCHFDNIYSQYLNHEDITDWASNLVFLDKEQVINGPLLAERVHANNLYVHGTIDGIDPATLVTKSGHHVIDGFKTFASDVTANHLRVGGLVDGVRLDPDNVLLTTGVQNVTGDLTFDAVGTTWLNVQGLVNGVDLRQLYEDGVRSDRPSRITAPKTFQDVVVENLILAPGATINGIDIVDLWRNAMWTEGPQEIHAPMTFQSALMKRNIISPNGINGIQIPGPRVVDINSNSVVSQPQVFETSTKISNLNVLSSLNGIDAFYVEGYPLPKLDIMLKSEDQTITGRKIFQTIHLDADSYVKGTVDGVDLSEFKAIALHRETSKETNRTWVFNNLLIKGPLVANKINGYNLDSVYQNALKLNDTDISEIVFKESIEIEELESNDINNIDVERDLVLKNRPQTITGEKTFQNIILEDNADINGLVNDIDISFFKESILRVGNQVLPAKTLNGNVKMNKVTVKGTINGVPTSEFITLSGSDQQVLHARDLVNVSFNEVEATDIEVGRVNGIDIFKMMKDTATYQSSDGKLEDITGVKTIIGTIHVASEDQLNVHYLNDVDVPELWRDAVLLESPLPQDIYGDKIFMEPVEFFNVTFQNTVDGILNSQTQDWMLRSAPATVDGNVVLSELSVDNIYGLVNGLDLRALDAAVVKTNEPTTISGRVVFENKVSSLGDVTLSGTIQNVDLYQDAVTRTGPNVISGTKTFTQDLVVEGDAKVVGLVDGVDVEDLCAKVVKKDQNFTHLTIKGDVTLLGGGNVRGKVGGMELEKIKEMAVTTDGPDVAFTGKKTFTNLTIEGPLSIKTGYFGGVDLDLLNRTYMSLTRDQDIGVPMEFSEVTFQGALAAKNLTTSNRLVNGVDIPRLYDKVLRIDGTQTVTAHHHFDDVVFENDVFVVGKVNGLELPGGLMRHNATNNVYSPKIFEKPVIVEGDLTIEAGRTIQGVDVSDWAQKAVMKSGGPFEIYGIKTFNDLTVAGDVRVDGLIDGIKVSEDDLLMVYGDQEITGRKTILGPVEVKGSLFVSGLINGVQLDHLADQTFQYDRTNTFTGSKHFTDPLTIVNLEATRVAGVDIARLERNVNSQVDFQPLKDKLEEVGEVMTKIQEAFNTQAVVFQYYELYQEFNIPTAYDWLHISEPDCRELLLLSDRSSSIPQCSSIRVFKSNDESGFVAGQQEIITAQPVSVKSLHLWGTTYLFVANQDPNPGCIGKQDYYIAAANTTSDIYVWNDNEFKLLQRIEMPPLEDMQVFFDGYWACVVYLQMTQVKVYCSTGPNSIFMPTETLPTRGGRKASVVHSGGKVYLAIAAVNLQPRDYTIVEKKPVDIYVWDIATYTFGPPIQAILSTYAQSVMLVNVQRGRDTQLFLVMSEGRVPRIQNEPKLLIYKFDHISSQFANYQQLNDYGQLERIVLDSGEVLFFALDPFLGRIKVYEYKGASGFMVMDTINSIGSVNIHAFTRAEDSSPNSHYLALAGPWNLMAQPAQPVDYAKILKSKMKGRYSSY